MAEGASWTATDRGVKSKTHFTDVWICAMVEQPIAEIFITKCPSANVKKQGLEAKKVSHMSRGGVVQLIGV